MSIDLLGYFNYENAIILIAVLSVFCMSMCSFFSSESKPNVLLIICDDLNTHVSTSDYRSSEHLHSMILAAVGMTFGRAYCQYPVCNPSRTSFLFGLYPQSTGVIDNHTDIRQSRPEPFPYRNSLRKLVTGRAQLEKYSTAQINDPGETVWNEYIHFENDEMPIVIAISRSILK